MCDFSDISKQLTKQISKNEKQTNGIFFTPKSIVVETIRIVKSIKRIYKNILEPSCGSCEFINELINEYPNSQITGIEKNKTIYDKISKYSGDKLTIHHHDFMNYKPHNKYDLIIGNPPYFVMKKQDTAKEYSMYYDGRPNIFILFTIKSLEMLKPGGILCFILPSTFLNCLYYHKLRKYINTNFKIISIKDCNNSFIDTNQNTIIFIVQNKKTSTNDKFIFNINNYVIFNNEENVIKLNNIMKHSSVLNDIGFNVKIGNITWNEHKDKLTDDVSCTRLIYSSDIKNKELDTSIFKNDKKKNFIKMDGSNKVCIIINRGYGTGKYKFDFCLLDQTQPFLLENHIICIESKIDLERCVMIDKCKAIIKSFSDILTKYFIETYFRNSAVNATEIANILAIFV